MSETERNIRVVHVDDDEDIRRMIDIKLGAARGIEIVARGQNGREAIQLANRHRPDVMILDINMPVLNGLEAAARIAKAFPDIGLVMLTSDQSLESIRTAFLKGRALSFLDKKTDIPEISRVVREADMQRDRSARGTGIAAFWSFYGPLGRAGVTTLAINSAMDLANYGYRVLLVDMNTMHGSCAFQLRKDNERPGPNLWLELPDLETIDSTTLGRYVTKLTAAPGVPELNVVLSPCAFVPDSSELGHKLRHCFEIWEHEYDYIVLDLPAGQILQEIEVMSLELSERLFVLVHRDLCGLKSLWDLQKVLRDLSFSPSRLTLLFSGLLTHYRTNFREWVQMRKIEHKSLHEVPLDVAGLTKALTDGAPIRNLDETSTYSRFVKDLVVESLNFAPEERGESGFWGRLKGLILKK